MPDEKLLAARRLQKQEASLVSIAEILSSANIDPISRSFFENKRARISNSIVQTRAVLSLFVDSKQGDLLKDKPKAR